MTKKITYEPDDYIPTGSSLKGTVNAEYFKLCEIFGEPNVAANDKIHTNWGIRFEVPLEDDPDDYDTHYVNIYDWKEVHPTASHNGIYRWHIGSKSAEAVWLVLDVLNEDSDKLAGRLGGFELPADDPRRRNFDA